MGNNHHPKTVIDLISLYEEEIIGLKSPKERAEKLLEIFEKHIEKCKNTSMLNAISDTVEMVKTMNDIELLNDLPIPMLFLRIYIENGSADAGGEVIEKIKEILNK